MKVRFQNIIIDIEYSEFMNMLNTNMIGGNYPRYFIKKDTDFKFLFNPKISRTKKTLYLQGMVNANFTCEICGKKHSYGISPYIDKNGNVDFHKIVCCCKECRTKKLEKRDIVKPVYKKKIDWRTETKLINDKIIRYSIPEELQEEYRNILVKMKILEKYTNLILPKNNIDNIKIVGKDINFDNPYEKRKFKVKLYKQNKCSCPVCGKKVSYDKFTIDHVLAKKLGGTNNTTNFIGMCYDCNQRKGHKTVMEFLCSTELRHLPNKVLKIAIHQQLEAKKSLIELNKRKLEIEKAIV